MNSKYDDKEMTTYDTNYETSFESSFQENEEETCEEITSFFFAEAYRIQRLVKNG